MEVVGVLKTREIVSTKVKILLRLLKRLNFFSRANLGIFWKN